MKECDSNSLSMNTRSGRPLLVSYETCDVPLGDDPIDRPSKKQPDVSLTRGQEDLVLIVEVSGTGIRTRDLILGCRRCFNSPSVKYVLGIDVSPLEGDYQHNQLVKIIAHLFQRDVNKNVASISVTSFGNFPMNVEDGLILRNDLIQRFYQGYNIEFRGIGFDINAPPCNDRNIS